jgi:hypothetical protein
MLTRNLNETYFGQVFGWWSDFPLAVLLAEKICLTFYNLTTYGDVFTSSQKIKNETKDIKPIQDIVLEGSIDW